MQECSNLCRMGCLAGLQQLTRWLGVRKCQTLKKSRYLRHPRLLQSLSATPFPPYLWWSGSVGGVLHRIVF